MKRAAAAGPILRWVGLAIELGSILALVQWNHEGKRALGIPVRHLLMAGVALGFFVWAVGLVLLVRAQARRSRSL
jgi:hypothetical protein